MAHIENLIGSYGKASNKTHLTLSLSFTVMVELHSSFVAAVKASQKIFSIKGADALQLERNGSNYTASMNGLVILSYVKTSTNSS